MAEQWTDREGQTRPIGVDDILVVSPYNKQVNLLRTRLPEGARVGTVDKFQGQEAAVVLISMVTSSGDDLSRQIEFLVLAQPAECGGLSGAMPCGHCRFAEAP